MSLSATIQLEAQDIYETSTTKMHKLGTKARTADGRVFRYALAGATNLATGKLMISPAKVTNHTNIAVAAAAAIGATQVSVTLGATAATADQYIDGWLAVIDSTGASQMRQISGHAAIGSGGTGTINLTEPLTVALTTSSKVSLVTNPWANVIVHDHSAVAFFACGWTQTAVTAANYCWLQTGGMASVLSDGVIGKGSGAIISDAVDGAIEVEVAGTVTQRVATAVEATVDAKYYPVYLLLDN